ncbi:23688_t:CDS:10 [Dentiscutata erythropus]|uniref:23688_t:CDS:1 n=1 Tax=Dentiscutata erythropus TaxID=1348616 RepID=A0A9N9GFW2_9GLOM|nr:23688_t:CDS:10 [Dentiscutata erythropus]
MASSSEETDAHKLASSSEETDARKLESSTKETDVHSLANSSKETDAHKLAGTFKETEGLQPVNLKILSFVNKNYNLTTPGMLEDSTRSYSAQAKSYYTQNKSKYVQEKFDDSSADQKLVKEWKLNHGLYLAGNNFIPSNEKILGYNGKLDIVAYSREPLVYAVVGDSSDKPKSFWDKLRDNYSEFPSTKETPINDISETDICLLFPIAEITYYGPINKVFKSDLNSEKESFITDNYAEYGYFFAKKLLAGGKLIIRNIADAKPVQIEHLKTHLAWALDSYHSQIENSFENVTFFDFPIIETTNKSFLKTPKDLTKWIRRLYEENAAEIISYEEIIPILTFLEKVEYINTDTFINRLVPGISNKHQEITLKDWIDEIPLRKLLTWISKFSLRCGMLIDQFGISLAKSQAFTFARSPFVFKRNNYYLHLIQPETRIEEILLRNNITHKLSSIPFVEYNSTTPIDKVYLFLLNEKIEISLDQCVVPLPVFKKAVENAVRSIHPYQALQEVFNEFGHFLPKSIVLGNQLREILKGTSNNALIKKKFVASSQANIDKILEYTKDFDLNYLLTSNGQVVMMNQVFNWFSDVENNDEQLQLIRIDQITPLYKILNYKLQNEIEIILENRLNFRILLTGVKTFDVDDNSTQAYVRINFDGQSVLDSSSYDVFGIVLDNEDIRTERCVVKFDLFDCYGFSAFVTVEDSIAKKVKGWHIIWMITGKLSLVGASSINHRETKIAFHKAPVDFTSCYDDIIYIPLPFTLAKNCIASFTALHPPSNNPPKQYFKLIRWSKGVLELKITALKMDQTKTLPSYINICIVYPPEKTTFKVDFGEKLVTYNLLPCMIQYRDVDIPFEAYFMQEVNHKNLVKYVNILEAETTYFLITELDNNNRSTNWQTLHHYLKYNGALSENQAKNIFNQVIECISFIYKHGFYNIKINDRNILISEFRIKLFNLENIMSNSDDLVYDIQNEGDYIISYASPEMISGHNYNSEFSDIWSLGILLYTMIHADVPFKKPFDTIARMLVLEKEISKECSTILHRLLAKKPHLRGSFKCLLNDSWIGIDAFTMRSVSNDLKENDDKSIAIEYTSNIEIIQELDELIEENKHHFHWQRTITKVALKECLNIHEDANLKNFLREEPSNRPNALSLANEIINWKLNKMHQFNDKKRLLSYMNKETEETIEKSQNDMIVDPENDVVNFMKNGDAIYGIENDENKNVYSEMKNEMKNGGKEVDVFGEYYKKAIDGDPEAMKNVAIYFLTGNGIDRDMKKAFSWFMKCKKNKVELKQEELIPFVEYFSQDSSNLENKFRYGVMLECGLGIEKDLVKAYLVYKNAAESGHARAQFKAGIFCEKAWGRKKDLKEAYRWFKKAIEQNNLEAWSHLNEHYKTSCDLQEKGTTMRYSAYHTKYLNYKITGTITMQIEENTN